MHAEYPITHLALFLELVFDVDISTVIWVALGGRGTLYGAIIGALVVNYGKTFFTGALLAVFQPRFFQLVIHSEIPSRTYLESVVKLTLHGLFNDSNAVIAAINSIRLFVVFSSEPYKVFSLPL